VGAIDPLPRVCAVPGFRQFITGDAYDTDVDCGLQAGEHNFFRVSEKEAFKWNPGAWPSGVKYFAHDVRAQ
jgi:hypothetical protein